MKIKLMRLIKGLAALSFTLPAIAAAQSDSPLIPDDQNTTTADMMNRHDNMLQGLLDSIWGGGTFTEQTTNLLGTLSGGVAPLLGMAVLCIMAYKLFMYTLRTGMAGESGGDQGPTRVSAFWSTCVPAIAFVLITPGINLGAVSSGYAPVQYIAYNALSTGISIADTAALNGVKYFTGSNLTTDNNGAYLGSGGAAGPISSADTDIIFNTALGANACRIATNKDLKDGNRHVILRDEEVISNDGRRQMIFSYDIVDKDYVSLSQPLNGFCGQIRVLESNFDRTFTSSNIYLMAAVGVATDENTSGSGQQDIGLHERKYKEDKESVSTFLNAIGPITDEYDRAHLMKKGEKSSTELAAFLKHSEKKLTDGIENNASDKQVKEWEDEIDFLAKKTATLIDLESKKNEFLEGQARIYTAAINKLNEDLTNTATKLVGEYENVAVDGITFEEELERRGVIVLGAQYWGVTQLSVRVKEMARLEIETVDATLRSAETGGFFGIGFRRTLDRDRLAETINDVYYSARPWNKNEVLTAKGAGYKASNTDKKGNYQAYTNDQHTLSLNRLADALNGGAKWIIGTSDNLVVSVQNLGDFIGMTGWVLYLMSGPMNPLASDADDGLMKRLIKVATAATLSAPGALTPAAPAVIPMGIIAMAIAAVGEFVRMISVPMMFLGAFMSYYIPAIPAVYFFMAMFGILIIFLEAIIVLPIWTVMLCLTSGEEGWETAHMRQGLILLLGLMGRLTGTVIIFFGVILLLETAAPLFVALLFDVYLGIFSTSMAGPLGWLIMMGGVAVFTYQIIIRSFSILTTLMDMIMQGLNAGHQTFGEQGDEDRGRTLVLAQMGRVQGQLGALRRKPSPKTE